MLRKMSLDRDTRRNLMRLAGPIIVQNVVNQSLGLLDTFMVAGVGEDALAGLALANAVIFVVLLFVFGVQSGACVLAGQYWGKRDSRTISRIMGLAMMCTLGVTVLFAVAMQIVPGAIMGLTSNDAALVDIAVRYGRITALSIPLNGVTLIFLGIMRAVGNPQIGMRVLIVSMIVNTILNYVLIYGKAGFPAMGVEGAALATLISRALEVVLAVIYAVRNDTLRIEWKLLIRPGWVMFKDFVRYTAPVVINETAWGLGFSLYSVIIGHLPDSAVGLAAFSLTQAVERVVSGLYFGVGHAVGIMTGHRLGEHVQPPSQTESSQIESSQTDVLQEGVSPNGIDAHMMGIYRLIRTLLSWAVAAGAIAMGLLFALVNMLVVPVIFPWLETPPEVIYMAWLMLLMMAVTLPVRAYNFTIIVGILRGGGDVRAAMYIDLFSMYLFGLPLALLAGFGLKLGALGVMMVVNIEEFFKIPITTWRFRAKRWLKNVTREI